jgi:hypothetical protein
MAPPPRDPATEDRWRQHVALLVRASEEAVAREPHRRGELIALFDRACERIREDRRVERHLAAWAAGIPAW